MSDRTMDVLGDAESLRLISAGGIGRLAYQSQFGPAVLPVNYKLHEGAILFRTAENGTLDEDLRTGIEHADYKVAFEVDDLDGAERQGWIVLIQGSAHHMETVEERASAEMAGVQPLLGGEREIYLRIVPTRITGRWIRDGG